MTDSCERSRVMRILLVLSIGVLGASGWESTALGAQEKSFFVVMATFADQQAAQDHAFGHGGWVLDTDLYTGLTPGLFASVRGPFPGRPEAEQETAALHRFEIAPGAYVRVSDGPSAALTALADELPSAVMAAVLGEIRIVLLDREGAQNPCAPQEPYQEIQLWHSTPKREWGGEDLTESKVRAIPTEINVGGFWYIPRTGSIDQIRICGE